MSEEIAAVENDVLDAWTIDLAPQEFRFKIKEKDGTIKYMVLVEIMGALWDKYQNKMSVRYKYSEPPAGATDEEKEAFQPVLLDVDRSGLDAIIIAGSMFELQLDLAALVPGGNLDLVPEIGPRIPFPIEKAQNMTKQAQEKIIIKLREMSGLLVSAKKAVDQAKNA